MKAVAAARQWWAARRPRPAAHAPSRMPPSALVVRTASTSVVLLALAVIGCAALGAAVTQSYDRHFAAARHMALQQALDELRAVFGNVQRFDDSQLKLLARDSHLNDLRFDTEAAPAPQRGREAQSLQDGQGRIIGWLSWAPDRAFIRIMDWLWGFVAAVGVCLLFCAMLARRAGMRLAHLLAGSIETERKLTGEDALTGLANQRVIIAALDRALRERGGGHVALALIDIDGFREVNDAVGRNGGDAVLLAIVERLAAALPEDALLGRFEDDAFAVVAAGADAGTAIKLGERLHAAFAEPIAAGQSWQISVGIGLAQAPADGMSGDDLARRAALALHAAKHEGRGSVRRFAPHIEAETAARRFLVGELKTAIAEQSFDVHYQPIVAADGSGIVGVEALLRWRHATRGEIPPSAFIPAAEQNGLMGKLGELVLRRALHDAARWPQVFVAVNVSPLQIRDPRFVALVGAAIAEAGIAPSRVVLEMTEGVVIHDPDETLRRLAALRALGVELALDDFGTGYSSLSYLQKFPFQRLKIDRAFVASLGAIGNAGAIIQSIVTLGHALGMSVLAEGIETDEQRVLLRLAGCDELQGFLFARPSSAAAIDALLVRRAGAGPLRAAASAS
jgi:diguanylate cyclase (GGDEF)-like protein